MSHYDRDLYIQSRRISLDTPTYFIADLASNHDGDLQRAKALIWKAKECGADAVKFQHFLAYAIVSDRGFTQLERMSHQKAWKGSIYEIYEKCELDRTWTRTLQETARDAGIHFMTSPYDFDAIEQTVGAVDAFKIGSGEITWSDALTRIAAAGKPTILATGASTMVEVERAVDAVLAVNPRFSLMQCNTNYTGSPDNFRFINLRVLNTFAARWPGLVLGISDHTPGHSVVLGAVTLGARIVEKHFTDDNQRIGPDHGFSMTPLTWRDMVDRTREVELALGDGVKRLETNEAEAAVVQRRCLRLARNLLAGSIIGPCDVEPLRPAPPGSVEPHALRGVLGRRLRVTKERGDDLKWTDLEDGRD
ncbi:N-acetylneuraminate synthase family protein [Shumkonia mesophila]|uniref:N-acetylneuraminate synthase family protein n=1 Tax=Shumkonia mesophila TaxID=2838854 RepID=UPI002934A273|nr:N-acetylneuraminate synthase family protein [Shumkonia mesophila]